MLKSDAGVRAEFETSFEELHADAGEHEHQQEGHHHDVADTFDRNDNALNNMLRR